MLAPFQMARPWFRQRDEGVLAQRAPRPGGPPWGPPHQLPHDPSFGQSMPDTVHGLPTVMLGDPMLSTGGTGATGAAAGLAAPTRPAAIAATAPPATAAATTIHFLRLEEAASALAAPPLDSATYWNETVPARACSLDARIRI